MNGNFLIDIISLNSICDNLAVVPVLVGPLQALIAILPGLLIAIGGMLISVTKPRVMLNFLKVLWRQKIIVVALGAFVYFGSTYISAFFSSSNTSITVAENVDATWDMFRGSAMRTGRSGNAKDPMHAALNWAFDTEAQTFYSSPTLLGNRVYTTSVTGIGPFNLSGNGAIYCLDADTGGIVWKKEPSGYRATFSSPSVSGKYLVVGEGLHECADARIFCLDVENNGEVLWSYETKSHVESSPCIFDGKVYIGAGDDGYYCFELEPDKEGKPVMVWHASGKDYLDAEASPLVLATEIDGQKSKRFYAGLGLGGKALLCLDADKGDVIWKKELPYPVFSPASFKDGRIYVGMGNGNFAETAEQAKESHRKKLVDKGAKESEIESHLEGMEPGGSVFCIDAVSGETVWNLQVARGVLGSIALGVDGLYFASRDGNVYLSSYEGKVKDSYQCNEAIVASPALGDEHVFVVTTGGAIFGLKSDHLELSWKSVLGQGALFISSPTLARGHVYVGTDMNGLVCVGAPEEKKEQVWSRSMGSFGNTGFSEESGAPEKGKYDWKYVSEVEGAEVEKMLVKAPCAAFEDIILLPISEGAEKGLHALDVSTEGKEKYNLKWKFASKNGCSNSAVIAKDKVFFVDGPGGDSRHLYCLNLKDGSELWNLAVGLNVKGDLVLDNEQLYLEVEEGLLSCLTLDGKSVWQSKDLNSSSLVCAAALHTSLISVVSKNKSEGKKEIITLDRLTGDVLWRKNEDVLTSLLLSGNELYAGTAKGLVSFNLTNGEELWVAETNGAVEIEFSIYKKKIACINQKKELFIVDQRDGSVLKTISDVHQTSSPLMTRTGVIFQGQKDLMVYSFAKAETKEWMNSSWLGLPSNPLIIVNSKIYYATDKKGLVCAKEK